MESYIEDALRAKAIAEKQFLERDFIGARSYALKAQKLCPDLEGISQMVATFGVYIASEVKVNGELDFYSILGVDPSADKSKVKKQYKKMAVLLHPDKNRTVGADGAFRLISEALTLLSDTVKRSSYDQRRNLFAGYTAAGAGAYDNCSKFPASHSRVDTFWTVCTSCHVQYEYLRKYVNKRLSCKNCRGVFIAAETGLAPINGSFPYSNYSYMTENGYASHGCGVSYAPKTTYHAPSRPTGHHSGYKSVSNISFQGNSSVNSVGVIDPSGLSTSSFVFYQANGEASITKANGDHSRVNATVQMSSDGHSGIRDVSKPKRGRPAKKRKMDSGSSYSYAHEETRPTVAAEVKMANVNVASKPASRLSSPPETSSRRCSVAPVFDARQLLIDKARSEIRRKLEEMRLASEVAAAEAEKRKALAEIDKSSEIAKVSQPELKRSASMSITVPDSDFHDFDKDRTEECFKPKQIWALYDEEDGMPRLYCLIREVISVNPFKIYISYLSSKSDCEFGSVNWLDSGFTKSCGSFRVFHSEMVEQVNIFSHLLSKEKAGRGGCVRIYPRCGDIWAVYRNWSPDWNRTTLDEVRHQYEMVEVLGDYSEENGVWVTPLVKLDAYKTVYQRNASTSAIRWIPRREMLRFSHPVPSCSLNNVEGTELPEGCWDLDPAATPDELLRREAEVEKNLNPESPRDEQYVAESKEEFEEKSNKSETLTEVENGACMDKIASMEVFLEQELAQSQSEGEYVIEAAAVELPPTKTIAKVLEELS